MTIFRITCNYLALAAWHQDGVQVHEMTTGQEVTLRTLKEMYPRFQEESYHGQLEDMALSLVVETLQKMGYKIVHIITVLHDGVTTDYQVITA